MEITPLIKDDFLVFQDETMLSEVLTKLRQFDKHAALIFRNNKYMGVIERKKLLKSTVDPATVKVSGFVIRTPILDYHANLFEAARLIFESDTDYLPVQKEKGIVGVIHSLDVAAATVALPEVPKTTVGSLQLVKTPKVSKDDKVATVINLMDKEGIDHVPLFEDGKLYGIVTFRDLIRRSLNWNYKRDVSMKFNPYISADDVKYKVVNMGSLPIVDFATTQDLVKVKAKATVKEAVGLMVKNKIHDVLVVDDSKFSGLMTTRTVLKMVSNLKVKKNFAVKFIGLKDVTLTEHQRYALQKISEHEAMKLQRRIDQLFEIIVYVKEMNKAGKQREFQVVVKVEWPGKVIGSEKTDWDLERAVHKCFNTLKVGKK
ncbi:CBS domain-containing protein [Candidatus Woesearchaeota archaeon]|nr:CBS domain-containing protein [Candidatus Woesearchaeota archaeon]